MLTLESQTKKIQELSFMTCPLQVVPSKGYFTAAVYIYVGCFYIFDRNLHYVFWVLVGLVL